MNSGSRLTLWTESTAGRPPFDWSYETAISKRGEFARKLGKFSTLPALVHTLNYTNPITGYVPLWSYQGGLGMLTCDSNSQNVVKYKIFDTERWTITDSLMEFTIGSDARVGMSPTIDGRLMIFTRGDGKVHIMDEDGSNFEYVGQTTNSWGTSWPVRIFHNYDGTHTIFRVDSASDRYVVNADLTITRNGTVNSTYPYTYMKIPGASVVTGSTGVVSVFDEEMTTRYVANRGVSSYSSMASRLMIPPGVGNAVTWGMDVRSKTIGINTVNPYSDITTTSTPFPGAGIDGCSSGQLFLPNGQLFLQRNRLTNISSNNSAFWGLYDWSTENMLTFTFSGTNDTNGRTLILLPTGKIFAKHVTTFELYDYGIDPKYCPINLCNGPLGYNGCYSYSANITA